VGGGAGCALTDGTVNVAVGFGSFSGATTAFANAVFGICAGCAYTTESGNAILGGYYGDAGDTNTVTLADGAGNLKAKFDSNGALSFDGTTFGAFGQVLTSNGSGAKPTWQAVPGGGIPCSTITGKGAIVTGTSASTPSALPVGNYGEVLLADSGCATGLKWGAVPIAGPISRGTVFGCTMDTSGDNNLAIGYYSLAYTSATCSVVLGNSAMIGSSGLCHIAIGTGIGATGSGTNCNVLVGNAIGSGGMQNSSKNTILGQGASSACLNGSVGNVVIGAGAGAALDMACQNVIIGCGVTVPTTTTDCALAIGFATGCHWVTGNSTKAIKPGAGIIDCADSCGTAGQVLMSNGANAVCWGTAGGGGSGTVTSITAGTGLTGGTITTSGTVALDTACVIQPSAFTAKGALLSASAASTPTALTVGTDGQLLYACSVSATGLCWAAAPSVAQATPTVLGTMKGRLTTNDTGLGCNVLQCSTGGNNVAIGLSALCNLGSTFSGLRRQNTAVGALSLCRATEGYGNVAVGYGSGCCVGTGANNVFIGNSTGVGVINGQNNIFIGNGASPGSDASGCLILGYCSGTAYNWLTGDTNLAIKPGAGIIDCAGSCGTAGQVLMSNGSNAICWGTAGGGGSGTVTSITAGTGLTGGTITNSGTVALDTACVIQPSAFTAKGDLLSASAAATPTALGVGTNGQVLSACSACTSGLVWATPQTSPFITYTTSAVSYTTGTPLLVAKWFDGTMQGTLTLDLAGYGGINQMWDFYISGQSTNYNTGWYQTASYPASSSDPLSQGTWYVDFPVYPDPNANVWMIYFSPSQNSLNPSTFTFFYRLFPGSSTPAFQI
jgi:hypothetical protein